MKRVENRHAKRTAAVAAMSEEAIAALRLRLNERKIAKRGLKTARDAKALETGETVAPVTVNKKAKKTAPVVETVVEKVYFYNLVID